MLAGIQRLNREISVGAVTCADKDCIYAAVFEQRLDVGRAIAEAKLLGFLLSIQAGS